MVRKPKGGSSGRTALRSSEAEPKRAGKSAVLSNFRRKLVAAAVKARLRAVAPYSGFQVGAALLTQSGEIIPGANVESASYGLTCCAERVALFRALTSGRRHFVAVAVVARAEGGPMPCGACRQLLAEYAPEAVVWVADSQTPEIFRQFAVASLLPGAFLAVPKDSD